MNVEDLKQWIYNPITREFFRLMEEQKKEAITNLVSFLPDSHATILLQIGKLLGKINTLDELIEADLTSWMNLDE